MAEVRVHAMFTVKNEEEFLKAAQVMVDATKVSMKSLKLITSITLFSYFRKNQDAFITSFTRIWRQRKLMR